MNRDFLTELQTIGDFREQEPMREHTSFQVGGPADAYIEPAGAEALAAVLRLASRCNVPSLVIGAGSNLLVSDDGFRGIVAKLGDAFDFVEVSGFAITAGAGVSLTKLSNAAQRSSLSGLEFAAGIPGNLGGAVFMNAGAYGGEMKDVVEETTAVDLEGNIHTVTGPDHRFRYRGSVFCDEQLIVTASRMRLSPGNPEQIKADMQEFNRRRREKQPLNFPSAGSTFKRPEGYFAGKLIQDAGLSGYSIGGASVSTKHSGFVINENNATALELYSLICFIRKTVYDKFGVLLEPEVRLIGDFPPMKP